MSETQIVELLKTNNYAIERALIVLYERQTADEQSSEATHNKNGAGFTAFDAAIFSSFAKQIIENKYGKPNGCRLSINQFAICRKTNKYGKMKIAKYARQLAEIAAEKKQMAAAAA